MAATPESTRRLKELGVDVAIEADAGVENPLFYKSNTRMLFGDARAMVDAVLAELRQLMLQKSA